MGESGSKPETQPYAQNFESNHSLVNGEYIDGRMGKLQIYEGEEGYVAVKKSFLQGGDENDNYYNTINTCPYLLKLYSYQKQIQKAMCGYIISKNLAQNLKIRSSLEITTYHEYYLNNLEAEIEQRQTKQVFYQETELWIILYSIVSASQFLEGHKKLLNDVRPQNIYITENGLIKLIPLGCFPDDMNAYQKVQTYNIKAYLPPEQLDFLRQGQGVPTSNPYKADTFAIGLTLLECATLRQSKVCYNFATNEIAFEIIQQHLSLAAQKYSKFFVNLIKLLLSEGEVNRPTPKAVWQILSPYQNQILSLQPFQPNKQIIQQSINSPFTDLNSQSLRQPSPNQKLATSYYRPDQPFLRQPPQSFQSLPNTVTPPQSFSSQLPVKPQNFQPQQQPVQQPVQKPPQQIPLQKFQPLPQQNYQNIPKSQQFFQAPFQPQKSPQKQASRTFQPPFNSNQQPQGFRPVQQQLVGVSPAKGGQLGQQQGQGQGFDSLQQGSWDQNDINDIDRRINEVLSRTKQAMERAGQLENQ